MSPNPQVTPATILRLTKNSPSPRTGVVQKSSAVELIADAASAAPEATAATSVTTSARLSMLIASPFLRVRCAAHMNTVLGWRTWLENRWKPPMDHVCGSRVGRPMRTQSVDDGEAE